MKKPFLIAILSLAVSAAIAEPARWTAERANSWYAQQPWLVGCNFTPSTAINQLEMWQADTFDLPTIDRELGWAEKIGFNTVRVFLHDQLWKQDSQGFLDRMEQFLALADKHHIHVMFVLFDSCWDPNPQLGKQREPRPFVHNSGWVQSPGTNYIYHPERLDELKPYVQGVLGHFRKDPRIVFWDVFNEPDNSNNSSYKDQREIRERACEELLKKTFAWAREVKPLQPLSSGVWLTPWDRPDKLSAMEKIQLGESDIITFHCYGKVDQARRCVGNLRRYGRPVICTEYMARPLGSTFDPVLGFFQEEKVGAFNWGFVSGKTQTIYPWDSWSKAYTGEPPLWFHDIFRADGTAYLPAETNYIRQCTLRPAAF
jgi:hypothetical protein